MSATAPARYGSRASLALIPITLSGLVAWQSVPRGQGPARSLELHDEGYVGSETCRECHAVNHASWQASFHRTMTQAPSRASVLGRFAGTTPLHEGRAWQLSQAGDAFFATALGPDGEQPGPLMQVALMTGSHHFQIYWLATPAGVLEQMPIVWHVGEARWVPRNSVFLMPPAPTTPPETDRWQQTCIKCHATNGTPVHAASGATRVAELGIACEACHGPGAAHAAWRRSPPSDEAQESGTGLIDPSELAPARSAQVCGQCHGIHVFGDAQAHQAWFREGLAYRPGDDLAATRRLVRGVLEESAPLARAFVERGGMLLEDYFWSDGEVRVSGREYNGLVESPCFQNGAGERQMTCVSCHEMHVSEERVASGWSADQLGVGKDGPGACLACHGGLGLPAAWRAHAHHAPDSSGGDCLSCHMPYTTFGLTKAIRSHTITSPSAAVALATGRPNACNQCHLDQSLGWTAERLAEWYGHALPDLDPDQRSVAASVLWALTGDAGQRALAAWSLGWEPARSVSGTAWMPYLVSALLQDEYDAVRWIAMLTARLDPRTADFTLDPFQSLAEQQLHVRRTFDSIWRESGLSAAEDQRAALLIGPDGTLDEARFRRLLERRDLRPVTLRE